MTVEPQNAHDPDDDDFYVLGEEDSETPASSSEPRQKPSQRPGHGPGTLAAEEDVLFVPTEEQRHIAGETPFAPAKGNEWEQELATADGGSEPTEVTELAPAEAEASDEDLARMAEGGDFAIIDTTTMAMGERGESADSAAAAGTAATAETDAGAAADTPDAPTAEEAREAAEEDDAWAPVESSGDPLLDGPGIGAEAQGAEGQEAQVAAATDTEAEDAAVAAAAAAAVHGPTLVAGRGAGQHRRRGRSLAAAAALLVFGGGGYLAWQQGWLGTGTAEEQPTLVERAEIPRPKVSVTPEPPVVGPQPDPVPVPDPKPDPKPDPTPPPIVNGDPQPPPNPKPDPVAQDPVPPVVETTPKGEPAPPGGAQSPQLPDLARDFGTLQVGDGLTIRETPAQEAPRERVSMNGIVPGSQAFAQLRNGNFFVGSVKAVETDIVTLKLEKGEITLAVAELKTIVSLASSEYKELKKVEQGFVRLNNRNRLLGTILASQDENIILENKANRVVIPKAEIEELGTVGKSSVRFADEDNSWVDRMIERQLSEQDAKEKEKAKISPAPLTEPKSKEAEKAKVKSVVDDDPGARSK